MKKVSFLFLVGILFTAITFTSCEKVADEIQDSVEVTINTEFEAPFVAVPTSGKAVADGSYDFKATALLDPANNADLADYLDKIKSIEITGIHVLVTSISDPAIVLNSGTFTLTDNVTGSEFMFTTPNNSAIAVGTTFEVSDINPGWDTVNEIIASMNASTIDAVGTINQENFEVGFKYVVAVKVVAKP